MPSINHDVPKNSDLPRRPSRSQLDAAPKDYLTRGAPFKADVMVVDVGDGEMVVKDFSGRAWWRRLIGRLEVSRECRAYAYLGPMPWFPAFLGCVDKDALAVEKIDGVALARAADSEENRDRYLAQLRSAMERLGDLGFLHLDARSNKNVLLRPDLLATGGDPRKDQSKPPRYVHGLVDLRRAWRRLHDRTGDR